MYNLILHGRRLVDLQKWRPSILSLQAFSSATDLSLQDTRKGKTFTLSYLIDSIGFTAKTAESISKKVTFEEKGNPDSVLGLLRSHGFTDSQISTIVTNYPRVLIADAENSLGPKLKFLQSRGASTATLTEIVTKVPKILGKRGEKSLSRYYDCVKDITEAKRSLKGGSTRQENKIRNVSILRELGVAQRLLFPLLISDSQPICGKEKFEESLKKVVEMGFDPATAKFVEALRVIYRMSQRTIEEKVEVYKRLGFGEGEVWEIFKKWPPSLSFSEKKITQTFEGLKKCGLVEHEVLSVWKKHPKCVCISEEKRAKVAETFVGLGFTRGEFATMVKRYPQCVDYSEETVKRKAEFLVKEMKWPVEALVMVPQVFGYSLEKRIIPRCNVIRTLMSRGVMGNGGGVPPMSSVLTSTDQAFISRYVTKHDELAPELKAILSGGDIVS